MAAANAGEFLLMLWGQKMSIENGNGYVLKIRFSVAVAVVGFLTFLVGAHPERLGLSTTPAVGFLQISFMTVGLGLLALGAYAAVRLLWGQRELSIAAQIGGRLIASGYVVAAASIMADVLGLGSQSWPQSAHFGPLQVKGMLAGEAIMALGALLLYPWKEWTSGGEPESEDEQDANS